MTGISIRTQFKYTAQLLSSAGMNINKIYLSKSTLHRQRNESRSNNANKIYSNKKEQLQHGEWILHWDRKTLNPLMHAN